VTGLTNGTRYYFRVAALNAIGAGPYSLVVNTVPRTVPGAPNSLTATPGAQRVALSWRPPLSDGGARITDYVIQRSTSPTGSWRRVPDGASTRPSYTLTGLTNGTRYYFRVAALNFAGRGGWSRIVSAVPRR
jgi:hypothetical protein